MQDLSLSVTSKVRVIQQKSDGHVKVEQVLILHGNKSEQPVLCVVLHSIFVHFIVSKTFEVNTCPTLHVRPTFADSHLVVSN